MWLQEHFLRGHRKLKDVLQDGPQLSLLRVRGDGSLGKEVKRGSICDDRGSRSWPRASKKLSQGSAGNPSRSLGGAPLRPSSLRTCCLATPHPDVPRLVLEPEVPGLQHPTHLCSQHLHFQPFSLPSCTCASWATSLLTQQVQTFSSGQDAPTTHPPGTPHAPAPTRESPTGPTRAELQFPSVAVSSCTFPRQEPLELEPLWDPWTPKHLRSGKCPGHLIQPHSHKKRY